MRAVILAGNCGFGRNRPSLWHITNIFAEQGAPEFFVALGYRAGGLKTYFLKRYALIDLSTDLRSDGATAYPKHADWKVYFADVGCIQQLDGVLNV